MKINKSYFVFILLSILSINLYAQDTIYVGSWNVENFFDTVNDNGKDDGEFTPEGSKLWTAERLNEKMSNLAKVIHYMNNQHGPDILALVEVEHKYLVDSLAHHYLPERNYKSVSFESPDGRGIQNALLYDADLFELIEEKPVEVKFFSDYTTRDILYVKLKWKDEYLNLFVNHWPSRRGGEMKSRPRRMNAASVLNAFIRENCDENSNIIIMGDFNDEPDNLSITEVLKASDVNQADPDFSDGINSLYNLAYKKFKEGLGTYLYKDDYNFLDQMIISKSLLDKSKIDFETGSFELVRPGFADKVRKGKNIILPSFHKGEYTGGYSDHYPIAAKFIYIN